MRRRLPPLEQIEAFVEAARGPSFRAAAERCALSPAAFSRRLQAFSHHLGVELFERRGNVLRLSKAGRACLAAIEPAFRELRAAALSMTEAHGERARVTLTLSHSLAVGWLIPRLHRFGVLGTKIELVLKTRRDAMGLRCGDADLALCFSDIDLSGLVSEMLLEVTAAPVAAPAVAKDFDERRIDLAHSQLLSVNSPPDAWQKWSRAVGRRETLVPGTCFDILQAVYESASQGAGIALGTSPTVWPYLEAGRLKRLPLPAARLDGLGYRLAARPERRCRRAVGTVWRWLAAEARRTPDLLDRTAAKSA